MNSKQTQTSCNRCGQCCQDGGPALHSSDLVLIQNGDIPISNLISIRKGELVVNPAKGGLVPAGTELLKVKGKGKNWICHYYKDEIKGCRIYDMRPQACEVLKCWDTAAIMDLMEKDTISRFDVVAEDSDLYAAMKEHEETCPCPEMAVLAELKGNISVAMKSDIEEVVRADLRFRDKQVKLHQLKLAEELFYFGRPIFQLLQPFGVRISETLMGIDLIWS